MLYFGLINLSWHGIDIFSLPQRITVANGDIMKYIPVTLPEQVSESLDGIGIVTVKYLSFEVIDLGHYLLEW